MRRLCTGLAETGDSDLNFGAFLLMPSPRALPHAEIYARGLEVAQAAEALGYDGIWLAEHHFSNYGYLSCPLIMATHLAARTSRIRIGTAVVVLPLHNPLMVAEEAATIDLLSEGRFDLGLGRGYQQYEFQRLGLDLKDSRARWEEAIEIVTRAFTEDSFSFQGEHFSFPETTVLPKPYQKPHPPIWVVGQSPESIDGAVRRGFNVVTGGAAFPIGRIEERREQFEDAVLRHGRGGQLQFGIQQKIYVTESEDEAEKMAEHGLWNMRVSLSLRLGREQVEKGRVTDVPIENEPSIQELVARHFLFGTPDTVSEKLIRLQEKLQLDHLNCDFWLGDMPHDKVLRSMELFARYVMPKFQDAPKTETLTPAG